ncbi:hypothetical protein J1N35_034470 [Gossypium stocksii]|uniref:Uncharacterized protein n=1 Tax=Gossypium stocksii TaxID=47602 RepID=A0A9D3USM7_9ROSI|nr:hypothetical protein J1N35_034470 [Gossypium stocksii]
MELIDLHFFKNVNRDTILAYLTKGKEKWKLEKYKKFPQFFNQDVMVPLAKMWMQFICTRHKQICIGTWINQELRSAWGCKGQYLLPSPDGPD